MKKTMIFFALFISAASNVFSGSCMDYGILDPLCGSCSPSKQLPEKLSPKRVIRTSCPDVDKLYINLLVFKTSYEVNSQQFSFGLEDYKNRSNYEPDLVGYLNKLIERES
ncbi:MAG TPA: hypothetical protein VIM96_08630, partial [Pseudomonadales bacterium]